MGFVSCGILEVLLNCAAEAQSVAGSGGGGSSCSAEGNGICSSSADDDGGSQAGSSPALVSCVCAIQCWHAAPHEPGVRRRTVGVSNVRLD